MRLLFSTAKLLLFPQKAHKQITEIFTIFTESAAHREPSAGINWYPARCSMHQVSESKPCAESEIMNKSITYYVNFTVWGARFEDFYVILHLHSAKECKDILLDSHTITTVELRANLHIGTVPFTGADFPYLKVVCGEPCDVWRKSAPLYFTTMKYNWTCKRSPYIYQF
jgi:hypothetical protein